MKKLLTILILLLAVVTQGRATNIQLWPETEYLLSDTEYCINSIFGNVTNSSTLRISYETTGDAPTLQAFHKNSSWTSADFYNNNLTGSPLEISISTDEQVSNLKERGLYLKGQSAKITKIELDNTQIWPEVSHQLTNWTEWNIKTKNFSSVVQNKKILISYSTEGSDNQLLEIVYKNSDDGWKSKNFDDTDFVDGTDYYTLTGNSEILTLSSSAATYLQKNGLYFRSRSGSITITKIEILNNVFDDNGSADLSNLVAEDGNTITSSGGNYTITSNSASSGATLTHAEGETITGKSRLVATFSAEQEVTVIANYTGTDGFSSITKGSDNGGSGDFVVVVPLDNSKTLDYVVIKKVTAGDIVLKSLVVDTETDGLPSGNIIGNDGKVDLTRFAVQDKDSRYNIGTFTLTPKEGYTGIQVWPESENITGKKELNVKFAEAAAAKIEVGYVSEGSSSVIMSEAAKEVKLMLDNTKTIQRVVIQPTTATAITLSEVALNTERTAYENEKELLNPSVKPTISHDTNAQTIDYWKFGNAAEGDKIIVYISNVTTETSGDNSGKAKLTMSAAAQRPSLGSTWGGYADKEFTANSTDLQEIIYKLTGDDLTNVKNQGFYVNAAYGSFQLEKITMISSNDIPSSEPSYTLTKNVTPAAGGSIQVQTIVGEVATNTDETSFASGTNLKLTATPATGYDFSGWTIGDDSQSDNPYTFSINSDITATATFTAIPAFSLDGFVQDDSGKATYNAQAHTLVTTEGWKGVQLWIGDNSTYSGNKLVIRTNEECKLKISVGYVNGSSGTDLEEENAVKVRSYTLDSSKKIQKVIIQNQKAETVTFTEMSLDPSYTLTITQPENGKIKNGESDAVTGTHSYGTEITLTAAPSDTYELSKWSDGTNDLVAESDGSLKVTMDGDKSVTAVFGKARTTKDLSTGSTKINGSTSVVIHKGMFANASVGDVITINISSISTPSGKENPGYAIKGAGEDETENSGYNWKWIEGGSLANDATSIIRTITSDDLVTLKASGLSIEGDGIYTCGKVTLTTAGEVGNAQIHSNPTYTLTVNATGGNVAVYQEDGTTLATGPYELETKLVLKATPSDNYTFMKWTEGTTDLTANDDKSLSITMDNNREITAVFAAEPLVNEERRTLWEDETGQALDWNDMFVQTAGVGSIVEAGEILIVTAKTIDTSEDHHPKITLKDTGGTDLGTIYPLVVGENKLSITSSMATAMAGGFKFQGESATITKIELYKPTPITALAEEDSKKLWSNSEGTALTWNNTVAIDRAVEWGAVLEEDERIIISVKAKESGEDVWPTVQLQNDTEKIASTANLLNDLTVPCDITITLTAEMVNKMKNGFSIIGDKATITKAVLYKPTMPTKTVHTLNSTETAISGEANVTVTAEKFANISAYDVLTVNFTITTSPANVIIKGNGEDGGWDYLKEMKFENGETLFALPLTPAMTSNLKKNGLQITGSGYTFKSVTIKTAGEVPSDEEKKDDEKKGDEEVIIDEKTGEADLNELSAQDDTKTTLTQNEDGSITMTTTEAYQAAQIWFNNPEEVAGNVLKVQLAESSVNVTVTVKYTDGTQSQMSANTMAAKARGAVRAATRADSGTEIEVPLETGKEVQNIEVKNNVAGTITIRKMQVTTINVFTNGVANLSMLKPQSNATYDTSTHTLATTKGWTGATISPVDGEKVSGKELLIEFAEAAKVKVAVKYRTDVEGPSIIMEKAAANVRLALDNTKSIQEILIQPTDAAIVTFTKIAVNGEESDDGKLKPGKSITLWENSAGEKLAWNEVAKQGEDIGEMLQEYDELLITVSGVAEDCDWPKVFLRDANSEQVGNEVLLNDVASFPYTVRIVLTGDMAEQLANGFCVCGDGITVTKLVAYRPEEPKEGDIHLADLNYGYNSSYDKGTHTITTTSRWAARGWEIGDKRYNDKNLIIVKFEPVDFPVTLKMEYTTGVQTAQATSVGVPAGRTELMLEIPQGISKLNRVYLIYEEPGSLKLTEASVVYQDKLKLSTAIQAFEAEGVIRDGRYDTDGWYNLRGMRIQEPKTSGVYIHGGKKVVIY